jgi:hypothetical protein
MEAAARKTKRAGRGRLRQLGQRISRPMGPVSTIDNADPERHRQIYLVCFDSEALLEDSLPKMKRTSDPPH